MTDAEWWDVLDADGVSTGEVFQRGSSGWPAGRFHLIVAVCVHGENGTVLLTQRAASKEFAFGWEFPGGSALAGESSRVAASRELREETGLEVDQEALTLICRFVEPSALLDFYIASATPTTELSLQASEVMASEWVATAEVERRMSGSFMAFPWIARLEALWPATKAAMSAAPIINP